MLKCKGEIQLRKKWIEIIKRGSIIKSLEKQ